ncbi:acyl-[ACP]--phospholipid O-acyltransferase [soil metagenome]
MSDKHHSQEALLPLHPHSRSPAKVDLKTFLALVATLFQGGLSDNIFRLLLMMMFITLARTQAGADEQLANEYGVRYTMILTVLFVFPYVLLAAVAGWLSDRFSKTSVTQGTKVLEIFVMVMATLVFKFGDRLFGVHAPWVCAGLLFLMGCHSALFSPSRYGIMPEIIPEARLGWGNGIAQGTYLFSIVLGTIIGPMFYYLYDGQLWLAGLVLCALGFIGLLTTIMMRHTPVANPNAALRVNPVPMLVRDSKVIFSDVGMRWTVIGLMVWWAAATMVQNAAMLVVTNVLDLSPPDASIRLTAIVVCQGFGCFIAATICRNRIEMGLVPLGAFGMFITSLVLYALMPPIGVSPHDAAKVFAGISLPYVILLPALIGIIGFTAGFFIVPLEAFLNFTADPKKRGEIWATTNVLTAVGMLIGTTAATLLTGDGRVGRVFLGAGIFMFITATVICLRFPTIPLRFAVLMFFQWRFRTRCKGIENVPNRGGALLAPNHQSYLDGIIISSLLDRPVRFVMSREVYNMWFVYPFARITRSIAIEATQSPRELLAAFHEIAEEIKSGGLVCLFPEGQLTRNGQMNPFRRGIERIMKGLDAPIIPVAIDGAFDTRWALRGAKRNSPPFHLLQRSLISVAFGAPLPADTPAPVIRERVVELMVDAFAFRKADALPLHRAALTTLRLRVFKRDFSDHGGEELLPNLNVLAGVAILGGRLRPHWEEEECVGIVLPPSVGAVIVNIAALAAGKIPVNLNYTTSLQIMEETCRTAGIKLIVASSLFLEKAKLELPAGVRVLFVEDLRKNITRADRIRGIARAYFFPFDSLESFLGRSAPAAMDDVASIIFSSGSTGQPKGVMLTHWNVASNVIGTAQYVELTENNPRFLGILPFFHSFGFMSTLWLPLQLGIGVSYYPNPLDARAIGAVVERYQVTHLFGTPTFLSTYARRVDPGQFGSLTFVLTGAAKLTDFIADAFRERFGITPREGFGATETSPVVSLNGMDWREPGIYQVGQKRGTIGQPIPGCAARIVDLETGEILPTDKQGMLLVRGHNVMAGYYKDPKKTAEVIKDGWYHTGDIATIDEDGFITIKDRLSRFSKIGGEMVPHIRIEEALQNVSGNSEPVFAVTAIPDEKKGERIAVLYTIDEAAAKSAADKLGSPELNLPALWQPKWADFIKVEALPMLGSGKADLRAMKTVAAEALGKKPGEA